MTSNKPTNSDKLNLNQTNKNLNELLQELKKYKIELETQNDELRCIQLELERSRNRYFELYDLAPIGYCTLNQKAKILDINKAGLSILGLEKYQIINQPLLSFVAPKSRDIFHQHFNQVLASTKNETCEIQIIKPSQTTVYLQLVTVQLPENLAQTDLIRMAMIDVTERHYAEEQLRQQQEQMNHMNRLINMGEMASTLAHELNQPLAAIVHYLGGCLERLKVVDVPQDVHHAIKRVLNSAERAGGIIQRVRNYCKKGPFEVKPHNINNIVKTILDCQQHELQAHHIHLEVKLDETLPLISVDSLQIEQVFVILFNNAIEAMQSCNQSSRFLKICTYIESPYLIASITDTGPGIPKKHLKSIFQPFTSFKPQGMGMGLAIAASIIDGHGGEIEVYSKPKQETEVILRLPLLASPARQPTVPQTVDVATIQQ